MSGRESTVPGLPTERRPPLEILGDEERGLLREGGPPKGSDAMKAVLTDARFSDPEWIFERKLDGIRCIAISDGGAVRLLSRNDLSLDEPTCYRASATSVQHTIFSRIADLYRVHLDVVLRKLISQ